MVGTDPDATRSVYDDISEEILATDRQFSWLHTGANAEYPVPPARETFAAIGVYLTDSQLEQYALSVADDWPFAFVVH